MANKDLEKRLEKLERKITNLEKTTYLNVKADREAKEPEYKVGDYVEYKFSPDIKKGIINFINSYGMYFISRSERKNYSDVVSTNDIIGYAKPELLTQEEKEYLRNIIKATGKEVRYIRKIIKDGCESLEIYLFEELLTLSYIEINKHYHRLKLNKFYNKKELGL